MEPFFVFSTFRFISEQGVGPPLNHVFLETFVSEGVCVGEDWNDIYRMSD